MLDFLSFHLSDAFVETYMDRPVQWGFDIGGGNSLGELTFLSKYSRLKTDGTKERWWECCCRVIEGMYSILKDHCLMNKIPWTEPKAQHSAQEAFDRMFTFKWLPPGRGLAMMGTYLVNGRRDSAALNNCSFLSFEKISSRSVQEAVMPFMRLMEMSMLGIGVGFNTKGAGKLTIHAPLLESRLFQIPDSREGWAESLGVLLESYFFANRPNVAFDYTLIRPQGASIKTFGGIAPGPEPLMKLHWAIRKLFNGRAGDILTTSDIVDINNLTGKCVVSGGIRRTAEMALGHREDEAFLDLKNWEVNPERMGADGWGYTSNNSVYANVGDDITHLIDRITDNGEPGILYLDVVRKYGRLVDPPNNKDYRASGTNPCGEQSLESSELCTLVETFPVNNDSQADFLRTLKFAYLYGKSVTLLPTPWPDSNGIMQRNRRIGCSVSGSAQFVERYGWTELRNWLSAGYEEIQHRDCTYSEWLGVRESIKTTSVKPSGTVSLLAGVTPGVHWPVADVYTRRMRLVATDPLLEALEAAGYKVEPDVMDPDNTMCVELPTLGPEVRTEREVSVWEKAQLAIIHQRYWADNQVSVTLTFDGKGERDQIGPLLQATEGQLKSVSLLPLSDTGAYQQMPYERITRAEYDRAVEGLSELDWSVLYGGAMKNDAEGDRFCTNDRCEIPL